VMVLMDTVRRGKVVLGQHDGRENMYLCVYDRCMGLRRAEIMNTCDG